MDSAIKQKKKKRKTTPVLSSTSPPSPLPSPSLPSLPLPSSSEPLYIRYGPFLITLVVTLVVLIVLWQWGWGLRLSLIIWVMIIFLCCYFLSTRIVAWTLTIIGLFLSMLLFGFMAMFGGFVIALLIFFGILFTLIVTVLNVCA